MVLRPGESGAASEREREWGGAQKQTERVGPGGRLQGAGESGSDCTGTSKLLGSHFRDLEQSAHKHIRPNCSMVKHVKKAA